jgi:hypothetical protein
MGYHITQAPMVHWNDPVIEPFRAIATKDRPVITSTKQNREYMARHDLVDANEVVEAVPTHIEQEETHKEVLESIAAITPTGDESATIDEMKSQGLMDPSIRS